jgi:hypothetical protein
MQRRMTWKIWGLLGATAVVAGLSLARPAQSADHRDAPKTTAEPGGDINDVFTWNEGGNVVMAMTVFPFAGPTAKFSDAVQYVFHTTSGTKFGETKASTDIICTFDAAQVASCWVGASDYLTGAAGTETGLTSKSGKTKVFAGRRGDPFFFNLSGFKDTVTAVKAAAPGLVLDPSGCPALDAPTSMSLRDTLKEIPSTADPARTIPDDFVAASGLVLVVSVDKTLVTTGGSTVSVWASTNKK